MDITIAQAEVLTAVDPLIEDSYSNGVVLDSSPFLPKLEGYSNVPETYKAPGRKGVESTFAALLKAVASTSGTQAELNFLSGFGPWPSPDYRPIRVTMDAFGVVRFSGLVSSPGGAAGLFAFAIPPDFAPSQSLIFQVAGSGAATHQVTVAKSGLVTVDTAHGAGWLSFQFQYQLV